jgi:hypothetical protein
MSKGSSVLRARLMSLFVGFSSERIKPDETKIEIICFPILSRQSNLKTMFDGMGYSIYM